jgi:hypothetical protein
MTFAASLWLLALVPWAGLAAWMLLGRLQRTPVPFLELWRTGASAVARTPRKRLIFPPFAIVCLLLASFLSILAAARPRITLIPYTEGPPLTIIVDRGLSMTALDHGVPRWKSLVQILRSPLRSRFGMGQTRLILIPDGQTIEADRVNWAVYANESVPAPADTRAILPAVVEQALRRGDEFVVVLTDQPLPDNPRLIQVSPMNSAENVGIVSAALSELPRPQFMVQIRNDSNRTTASLRVDQTVHVLPLPPRGQEKDYFIDLQSASHSIALELVQQDDQPLDNTAHVSVGSRSAGIEPQGDLPPQVRKVINAYEKARGASETGSSRLLVTTQAQPPARRAVVLAPDAHPLDAGTPVVVDHSITQFIDWPQALHSASIADPPGDDWEPIVTVNGRPLVAVRTAPARQAWVGFSSPTWPRTSDFVIFWTNVFDWTSGVSQGSKFDGVSAIPIPDPPVTPWAQKLRDLPLSDRAGAPVAPVLLAGCVILVILALAQFQSNRPVFV